MQYLNTKDNSHLEHKLDTVGVAGSIPVEPTISEGVSGTYLAPSFYFDQSQSTNPNPIPPQKCEPSVNVRIPPGCQVDPEDIPRLVGHAWYIREGYVVCRTLGRMHRFLMGAKPGQVVDHIDGNPLNNRRSNLRICTQADNVKNRRKQAGVCTSIYKGVWFARRRAHTERPWRAHIRIEGWPTYIGSYATETEAAQAYDAAALKHHGEFARLNFPKPPHPSEAGR